MPPRTTKDRGPDGAKPGDAAHGGSDKHAFDADARAKAREDAPITVGAIVFHRRRKNWETTRGLRKLLRVQERASGRADRLRARISSQSTDIRGVQDPRTGEWIKPPLEDEAKIDAIESVVEGYEDDLEVAVTEADEAAYSIIALLLRSDDGAEPDIEHLKKELDVEEAAEMAGLLANGGEPDPTPETPSSSS